VNIRFLVKPVRIGQTFWEFVIQRTDISYVCIFVDKNQSIWQRVSNFTFYAGLLFRKKTVIRLFNYIQAKKQSNKELRFC